MGSDRFYPEEAPSLVAVGPFLIDRFQVTNDDYRRCADATGYRTVAERPLSLADYPDAPVESLAPGSLNFQRATRPVDLSDSRNWWAYEPGACWRHPQGPASSIEGIGDHPVVQVAYEDAQAFAMGPLGVAS